MKKIYIVNGKTESGKDTFIDMINEIVPALKYSIIDSVKYIAEDCGWDGAKTEKDRKFLSDLKILLENYNDLPFENVKGLVNDFKSDTLDEFEILFLIMREKKDIDRAVKEFGAETIFIKRDVTQISSNAGDAGVMEFDEYDYMIDNNGSVEALQQTAEWFVEQIFENFDF